MCLPPIISAIGFKIIFYVARNFEKCQTGKGREGGISLWCATAAGKTANANRERAGAMYIL